MKQQIITLGGGGFSTESDPSLDEYILQQARTAHPRIGFVPTASGDAAASLLKFYARFAALECMPTHLSFFGRTPDLRDWTMAQDVIFVGGGNTRSMLAIWREWGFADILKEALQNGAVLAGVSAGAICWFEHGVTDSHAGMLAPIDGLGFLRGSCCPHYSQEAERRPAFEQFVRAEKIPAGVAIDDGAALHFIDGKPVRVVAGRTGAGAYLVSKQGSATLAEN
ncbi:peptidase E [Herbaspirillum sp. RV1423]|uniref:Type 1 glutamine amidotransferase-like domain-containing protein n=1 Tax=Herbaspirillum sp. RV1423 TaxID=1443993 RepID=UPI0004BB0A4F|nr:peptidase E [Herbaspirillum sp. RV1423]